MSIEEFATNIELKESGFWIARATPAAVSYPESGNAWCPEGGNAFCLSVEDSSFWFAHRNNCIIEVLKRLPPEGLILDVGGGNGFVALAIEKAGWPVALVEPGVQGAINAQARGLSTVINCAFDSAGFKMGSIPAVGLFDVLEHIPDDLAFLKSIRSTLTRSGRLYLSVPAFNFLWSQDDVAAGHFRRYSSKTISRVLMEAGFRVEFLTHIFFPLPLPILLLRALPTRTGLRNSIDWEKEKDRHEKPGGLSARWINRVLSIEADVLRRGYSIPFGGSVVVVATPQC
jgi:SAM-dependent methyltransferase